MDPLLTAAATKATELVVEQALAKSLDLGWKKLRWLPTILIDRRQAVRVSCSAFVRIRDDQQRYVLIRNLHRPDFFGPLGGCYKYFGSAAQDLQDRFFFASDTAVSHDESSRDLRGYVRRAHTADFFKWFANSHNGRESTRECLARELAEELIGECKLDRINTSSLATLEFTFVRSHLERSKVSGTSTLQFRHFEVFDLALTSPQAQQVLKTLRETRSSRLLWASQQEIESGRHTKSKSAIGHAAVLLVNDRLTRPDLPSHPRQ